MGIGENLDRAIGLIAPRYAATRAEARLRSDVIATQRRALGGYDAVKPDRRNRGRRLLDGSANREAQGNIGYLSGAGHDLVRNNKYASSGIAQMVGMAWGDGIAPQAVHRLKTVQRAAQDALDRFAESRVDGFGDWYGFGKIAIREMFVGGESLTLWKPDATAPNGRVSGIEGAQLDAAKTVDLKNGHRIIQGVEFDADDMRVAYWMFARHPRDLLPGSGQSRRVDAAHVDHLFERTRHGQARGVSWLAPVATTLRDIRDLEDARLLREKIQNCLALILQSGNDGGVSPMALGDQDTSSSSGSSLLEETLRPGMIGRMGAGESATVVNPSPALGTVEFMRQQLAAVSANMVPYHLMTGDVSGASYTTLRAAMNGAYSRITDWQQNEIIPLQCRPMAERVMQREAMRTGDVRFLDVRFNWALPRRYMVDPIKDLAGEIMEIRAGLQTIRRSLGDRGLNVEDHFAEIKSMNDLIDRLGLALDSDPRRVTDAGQLQQPTGWLAPKD